MEVLNETIAGQGDRDGTEVPDLCDVSDGEKGEVCSQLWLTRPAPPGTCQFTQLHTALPRPAHMLPFLPLP